MIEITIEDFEFLAKQLEESRKDKREIVISVGSKEEYDFWMKEFKEAVNNKVINLKIK